MNPDLAKRPPFRKDTSGCSETTDMIALRHVKICRATTETEDLRSAVAAKVSIGSVPRSSYIRMDLRVPINCNVFARCPDIDREAISGLECIQSHENCENKVMD